MKCKSRLDLEPRRMIVLCCAVCAVLMGVLSTLKLLDLWRNTARADGEAHAVSLSLFLAMGDPGIETNLARVATLL